MMVRQLLGIALCFGVVPLVLGSCAESAPKTEGSGDPTAGDPVSPAADDGPVTCPRLPKAADRDRYVVISHPYDDSANPSSAYEVFRLSQTGTLTRTNTTFSVNRMNFGEIVFTPDGALGFTVGENDYTIGVFALHDDGTVEVLNPGYESPNFTPSRLVVSPNGTRLLVIDGGTPENGGGIYSLVIGCDGSLTEEGLLAGARTPGDVALLPDEPSRWLLAGNEVNGAPVADDLSLMQGLSPAVLVGGGDLFSDNEQLVVDMEVTADGRYALVADGSSFSGLPNRIAVAEILENGVALTQTLSPLIKEFPTALAVSPFNNAVLMVTAESCCDGLSVYAYDDTDSVNPFTAVGEITYNGHKPELPSAAQVIKVGGLKGRVLIPENLGIRQVQFLAGGTVADLGKLSTGSGYTAIVGALGVQP